MIKLRHLRKIVAGGCFALFASHVYAITVIESGDLPIVLGPLDIGSNSISGSLNASVASVTWYGTTASHTYSGDNRDSFTFTVPSDSIVTGLSITISNYTENGSYNGSYISGTARGFGGTTSPYTNVSFSNDATLDSPGLLIPGQLSPGDYSFQFAVQCGWSTYLTLTTCAVGDSDSFDWQLNLTTISTAPVSEVPLPAAVWLFGSGLLGLIGISRRHKVV